MLPRGWVGGGRAVCVGGGWGGVEGGRFQTVTITFENGLESEFFLKTETL